jgi:hypothetical protein
MAMANASSAGAHFLQRATLAGSGDTLLDDAGDAHRRLQHGVMAGIDGLECRLPEGGGEAAFSAICCWLGNLDSNQDKQSQSLLCYRYTIPQRIAEQVQGLVELSGGGARSTPNKSAARRSSTRLWRRLASAQAA